MKWFMLLISPSEVWEDIKDTNWLIIPILVGTISALCSFYVTIDPNVMYHKAEAIVRLSHNTLFSLPEGEGVVRFAVSLGFILLPVWYIVRTVISSLIAKRILKDVDYKRLLFIFSLSLLPLIPLRLVILYFIKAKGLENLVDLKDLNITLSPVLFYALNRDMLKNDMLYTFLREISLENIWSMFVFIGLSSSEGMDARRSILVFLTTLIVVRVIEILWENYSYNIIWFLLVGG
ncbi:MAG: hypothetical protein N2380_09975 [bacterium]|nr:hypothetical protein [bacterium]